MLTVLLQRKQLPKSCDHITSSAEVVLLNPLGPLDTVYCTRDFTGDITMLFHPDTLLYMTSSDLAVHVQTTSEVVLLLQAYSGQQKYGRVRQLAQFQQYAMAVSHGLPMYVQLVPAAIIYKGMVQGIQVNGINVTFQQCDTTAHSSLALYHVSALPTILNNYSNMVARDFTSWPLMVDMVGAMYVVPATDTVPAQYLCILNTAFGGCGSFAFTGTDNKTYQYGSIGIVASKVLTKLSL